MKFAWAVVFTVCVTPIDKMAIKISCSAIETAHTVVIVTLSSNNVNTYFIILVATPNRTLHNLADFEVKSALH